MTEPDTVLRENWGLDGTVEPLGEGHINDTYLVTVGHDRYVLQRINQFVFQHAEILTAGLVRVVDHLNRRRANWTPAIVRTQGGLPAAAVGGEVWRLWTHIEGRSLTELESDAQARAAGRAFGETQAFLADLVGPRLQDPIHGFLQLDFYLEQYAAAEGRAPKPLAKLVDARRHLADSFRVRDRYVHGDCKVNNLLFDDADRVCAVLDLDTVMWGNWAWDFGDLARSASVVGGRLSVSRFVGVADGFLAGAGILPRIEELVGAPQYVAFMLGVRFLTDHLNGDRYFKIERTGDNLERAEEQFEVLRAFEAVAEELRAGVEPLLAGSG